MTAKVHKKCRFFQMYNSSCSLTQAKRHPWENGCASYEVKPLININGLDEIKPIEEM